MKSRIPGVNEELPDLDEFGLSNLDALRFWVGMKARPDFAMELSEVLRQCAERLSKLQHYPLTEVNVQERIQRAYSALAQKWEGRENPIVINITAANVKLEFGGRYRDCVAAANEEGLHRDVFQRRIVDEKAFELKTADELRKYISSISEMVGMVEMMAGLGGEMLLGLGRMATETDPEDEITTVIGRLGDTVSDLPAIFAWFIGEQEGKELFTEEFLAPFNHVADLQAQIRLVGDSEGTSRQ